MDGQTEAQLPNQDQQVEINSWAAAFEAFNKAAEKDLEADTTGQSDVSTAEESHQDTDSNDTQGGDSGTTEINIGGSDNNDGTDTIQDTEGDKVIEGVSEQVDIEELKSSMRQDAEDQAIDAVARDFIDKGVRHRNGRLGAFIDDPDIMKRDSDGVPHFYNPDTGQEFTGDNPRRQAKEWVDDYNAELAQVFNNACDQYIDNAMKQAEPQLAVLEFSNTYDELDPVRQAMLDSLLEDYEIKNSDGQAIGYSVDLNKALQAVNRQVSMIQEYSRANQTPQEAQPSGPALDMKNSTNAGGGDDGKPKFNSIAEAMEYQQNQLLQKGKK